MWQVWFLPLLIVVSAIALSLPAGRYLTWVMDGKVRPPRWLAWFEQRLNTGPQSWKQYALALLLFNTVMFLFGFLLLSLQQFLPLNQLDPDGTKNVTLSPTTVFITAISFLTNTNLQHYAGEVHLTYFSQVVVIVWNMFVSAAVGFSPWRP